MRFSRYQLDAGLIQADLRPKRIVGPHVDVQHVLQVVNELAARPFWQAILLFQPRLEFVFLSVCRTVSYEMSSTISSSTSLSASRRNDHRPRPFGAGLHASVTRRASWTPSSLRGCNWRDGRGRSAASRPSSTHRIRTRSTVERLTSTASAICSSVRRGPSAPSSAFNRTRACAKVRAAALPFDSSSWRCARSPAINVTQYSFFIAPQFTGSDHLSPNPPLTAY